MSFGDHAMLPEIAELGKVMSGEPRDLVIFTADLVGYSEIVFRDVHQSIVLLRETRSILTNCIRRNDGKTLQTPGDFILAAFEDFESALRAAVSAQEQLLKEISQPSRTEWRIGR